MFKILLISLLLIVLVFNPMAMAKNLRPGSREYEKMVDEFSDMWNTPNSGGKSKSNSRIRSG
uniref:SP13 phlebotomine family member n=1 Tax=Nyssomyia intermedia TaxID=182990 RepID=J7HBS1_9DIPT